MTSNGYAKAVVLQQVCHTPIFLSRILAALAVLFGAGCVIGEQMTGPKLGDPSLSLVYSFAAADNITLFDIFVATADGTTRRRLVSLPGIDRHAAWSPDGNEVVFQNVDPTGVGHIMIISASG